MIRKLAFLTLSILALPVQAEVVMVFGDSLSSSYGIPRDQGWVSLLAQRLKQQDPRHQVLNHSLSGETTGGGLYRLEPLLRRHRPHVVILELGGNDGLRGVPPARIQENLTRMTKLANQYGARVVLAGMTLPPNYGKPYIQRFENVYKHVAKSNRSVLIPSFLKGLEARRDLFQPDGIHPTAAAQPILVRNVLDHLTPLLRR